MSKDIEMNYKGGQEYEVIYPKSVSNIVLLSNAMNEFYGYENGTLDDALLQQLLGIGTYGYQIKVVYPDGSPVVGSTVSGITAISGRDLITDENGVVLGTSKSQTVTIGASSPYIDVKAASGVSVQSTGMLTNYTVSLQFDEEIKTFSSSNIGKLSPYIKTFDICAVAGGGGAGWSNWGNRGGYGSGGGGGYVQNVLGVNYDVNKELEIGIGSGGSGGVSITQGGGKGGSTVVSYGDDQIINVQGGNGGEACEDERTIAIGGTGNGIGGNGEAYYEQTNPHGYDAAVKIFNENTQALAGGGGGAGGTGYDKGSGGEPYGANSRESARGFGGGGAGATSTGGRGGAGGIYIRFHH